MVSTIKGGRDPNETRDEIEVCADCDASFIPNKAFVFFCFKLFVFILFILHDDHYL